MGMCDAQSPLIVDVDGLLLPRCGVCGDIALSVLLPLLIDDAWGLTGDVELHAAVKVSKLSII